MNSIIDLEDRYCARNYRPLPVVLVRGEGPFVWDDQGSRYVDMMSAYSAVSHGHAHPRIVAALARQAQALSIVSRAFHTDRLAAFLQRACELTGQDSALPMNTGAEAVETAIKTARRWGYRSKKIPTDKAEIIVCENNFHGRTTTIVGFSSEQAYRDGFGPFTPGFVQIPFGDIAALEKAITPNTCAFLVEPIQAEAGILIPPAGYLKAAAELCRKNNVLFVLDEIQTGLGRTGRKFACDHEGVRPDMFILGKALSGGFYPVSAVVSSKELLSVFDPGSHGSTFGGNPLACAIARTALWVLGDEQLAQRSDELGTWFLGEIAKIEHPEIREVRGRGLLIGIELTVPARKSCEALKDLGMLCKETHDKVIRIAPPLVVERDDLAWAVEKLREVFAA